MNDMTTPDPGNAFALGVTLGELRTRFAALEAERTADAQAASDRLAKAEARLDEAEARIDGLRQAALLLASNAGKRFVQRADDATGEDDVLALEAAPKAVGDAGKGGSSSGKGGASSGKGGASSGKGGPASGGSDAEQVLDPGDVSSSPGRTGMFDAYRKVKRTTLI
jgi:peptidoglycan DL-endopeptidase CwlO